MEENLKDLDELKQLKNPPRLKFDPVARRISVENKEMCRDIKDLDEKVKLLEQNYEKLLRRLATLQTAVKRSLNISAATRNAFQTLPTSNPQSRHGTKA